MAHDLAEVGVILLMFGVGLHFNFNDLLAVRNIARPGIPRSNPGGLDLGRHGGAVAGHESRCGPGDRDRRIRGQHGGPRSGPRGKGPASDQPGHIAVGWLVLEDIFTVLSWCSSGHGRRLGAFRGRRVAPADFPGWTLAKFAGLILLFAVVGRKAVPRLLNLVAHTRSRELFTLAILSLALAIATASAVFFDVSIALGAFLAGIVVGQTEVSTRPPRCASMRDAFAVPFLRIH